MLYKGTLSKATERFIHLIFWLIVVYFTFVKNPLYAKFAVPDLFYMTYVICFVSTFYFHYLIVMRWAFNAFKWKKLFLGIFISYLVFTGLRWVSEQVVTDVLFHKVNYVNTTFISYMLDNMHYSSMPIVFSSLLWFAIYFIRLLEYNKIILEENKNTEIKFLKAQINPHFVFNTLNNIYSMVYFQSDKSLPAIEKLSQIMRFTTYESQKEKIKLADEIGYINAYLELEQLRHEENAFVELQMEVLNEGMEIPPYLLSPLVENALKHGIASNSAPIIIHLHVDAQKLTFRVENGIGNHKKDKLGGIGLDNLKKRLEIYYPQTHDLKLQNKNNLFTAELQINL
ncbi:sensor histidine kinase [Sphingobacterium sp.]|uniref:sensor histidine kinase n=1 Tax=Sphingobacterium sp. TaxID=341027 RepID=UPI0028AC8A50|nr:histidine kinase [Sphingobacterium sp.]